MTVSRVPRDSRNISIDSSRRSSTNMRMIISLLLVIGIGALMPLRTMAQTFNDVPADYWAFSFIETLARSGISAGCGNNNYCPENPVTRAQMAVFLERGMRGSEFVPAAASGTVFLDVGATDFAADFVEKLFIDGITAGCGNNNYCPGANVSRAQMAVFLLRAKHGIDYSPPSAIGVFGDVDLSHWAIHWIEQLAAEGITSGCGGNRYCPESSVNRAQMAVFLVRTFLIEFPPVLQISVADTRLVEGDSGTSVMTFSVTLNMASNNEVSVFYETIAGTALDGEDYIGVDGQLVFSSGETQKSVEISIVGDTEYADGDGDEDFSLALSNPSGAIVGQSGTAIGSIINDDLTKREAYDQLFTLYNDVFLEQIVIPAALPGSFSADRIANIDLDSDGDMDILAGVMLGENIQQGRRDIGEVHLFRNLLGKGFEMENTGIEGFFRSIIIRDFNGDGRDDAYLAEHGLDTEPFPGHTDYLYLQSADGGLIDVTATNLPTIRDFAHGSCAGDFDLNGAVDVMTASGSKFKLMMNDGSAVFTDLATTNLPLEVLDWDYIVLLGLQNDVPQELHDAMSSLTFWWCETMDADLDGDIDILLGGWALPGAVNIYLDDVADKHFLLFNDGTGVFEYDSARSRISTTTITESIVHPPAITSMVVDDFNSDGCPDFMAAAHNGLDQQHTNFFVNDCNGGFTLTFSEEVTEIYTNYFSKEDINSDGVTEIALHQPEGDFRLFELSVNGVNAKLIADSEIYNLSPEAFLLRAKTILAEGRWPVQ